MVVVTACPTPYSTNALVAYGTNIIPDCTYIYTNAGTLNGQPYYRLVDQNFFQYYNSDSSQRYLTTNLTASTIRWNCGVDLFNPFVPEMNCTGTLTFVHYTP